MQNINTESLTSGNYVIRIKTSQAVVSKKFTITR
ncbi:MAG: T9SS type A sorting domain-containing protein [Saprospiraceae bacterium]|nr:T9SS type A sorting domain-containing protein [Saprospiraceae bacterium]